MESQLAHAGTREIGRHVVLRPLARGGMAELFLARTTGLVGFEKIVALKRILPQFAGDPDFVQMFLDEARLAAKLDHPNVAHVYDIGRDGTDYYFTMEYIHGEDLRAVLKRSSVADAGFPLSFAVAIAAGVAAGLHHAHSRVGYDGEPLRLVHRDVSPTNVLVSFDGAVKVVDFGVAKAAAASHVTNEGTRKGKFAYMSPEQCQAEPVDARSDVFAIGILLYEMCTLRRPFRGDNEFAIMRQIVEGNYRPPSAVVEDIPAELETIIVKAMAGKPAERYQTARELQEDLETLARERKWTTSPGALGDYLRELFGPKPYPWEGVEGIGEVEARPDGTFVATADGVPTKKKAMPITVVAATGSQTEVTPPRRSWALPVVLAGLAAAGVVAAALAWFNPSEPAGPAASVDAKAEAKAEPGPEAEAEPEPEPEPEAEAEPEPEPEPEPAPRRPDSEPEAALPEPTQRAAPRKTPRPKSRARSKPRATKPRATKPKPKPKPKPKDPDEPVLFPI